MTSPAPGTGTGTLRERKKQRVREEIYNAALDLLAEQPYDKVSVDDICARAQVGRATFFRFYGTKAGLLAEFNRRLAELARTAIADHDAAGSPVLAPPGAAHRLRLVQRTLAAYWAAAGPAPRKMALAFITEGSIGMLADGDDAVHPDLLRLVTEIVRRGQAAGELDTRLAPDFIAWLIVTALAAATGTWLVGHEHADLDRTTADTLDVLLTGLTGAHDPGS
jgi:AcrR family transcriptional regulator